MFPETFQDQGVPIDEQNQDRFKGSSSPNARLLHRFYEPLQLLYILNPSRGPGEVDLPAAPYSRDFKLTWRRFLDDLSWLCDNRHGGETVSAVAAQSLSEGNKFWLASKHQSSFEHFQWVLSQLKHVDGTTDEDISATGLEIAEKSIHFSEDKIKNYLKFFRVAYERAQVALLMRLEIEPIDLSEYVDDHLKLCRSAKQFRRSKQLMRLVQRHDLPDMRSNWASVLHFIGRLGCWFGKCHSLASTARQFPQLLHGATCEFLPLPNEVELPIDRSKADLKSALKRMLPANQEQYVNILYDQLSGMRLFNIPDVFSENLTDGRLQGRVHAEVFLLEHFYLCGLQFVAREKYVGCSKPSCYCCSLYMRFHPGNPVMRPAHNNVYVSWVPPLLSKLGREQERKHNLDIMNQMNSYIRRDVKEEIEQRMPRRQKGPDSTTGIDSYVLDS